MGRKAIPIEGNKFNNIRVLTEEKFVSPYYSEVNGVPVFYKTGMVICRCLLCGQEFRCSRHHIKPNNLAKSRWSCGCINRPTVRKPRSQWNWTKPAGRKPQDITDCVWGQLEPLVHEPGYGWICKCTCGKAVVVPKGKDILEGKYTACDVCKPSEWKKRKPGRPRLKEWQRKPRRPRLAYLESAGS